MRNYFYYFQFLNRGLRGKWFTQSGHRRSSTLLIRIWYNAMPCLFCPALQWWNAWCGRVSLETCTTTWSDIYHSTAVQEVRWGESMVATTEEMREDTVWEGSVWGIRTLLCAVDCSSIAWCIVHSAWHRSARHSAPFDNATLILDSQILSVKCHDRTIGVMRLLLSPPIQHFHFIYLLKSFPPLDS